MFKIYQFMFNSKRKTFQQEYITFNHDLTRDAEPILNGDWKDSRFLMPFVGFEKDKYPEVVVNLNLL